MHYLLVKKNQRVAHASPSGRGRPRIAGSAGSVVTSISHELKRSSSLRTDNYMDNKKYQYVMSNFMKCE